MNDSSVTSRLKPEDSTDAGALPPRSHRRRRLLPLIVLPALVLTLLEGHVASLARWALHEPVEEYQLLQALAHALPAEGSRW